MSADDALEQLQRGHSVPCVTPDGVGFWIESIFSYGMPWYRARPARRRCLNKFSRLDNDQMLQWLNSVTIVEVNHLTRV